MLSGSRPSVYRGQVERDDENAHFWRTAVFIHASDMCQLGTSRTAKIRWCTSARVIAPRRLPLRLSDSQEIACSQPFGGVALAAWTAGRRSPLFRIAGRHFRARPPSCASLLDPWRSCRTAPRRWHASMVKVNRLVMPRFVRAWSHF